jgi:hypothetical protein
MLKVKHERECDCVVAGFRWHRGDKAATVGSLLLGLYDREGNLQHVGVCANFTGARRGELVEYLRPYGSSDIDGHPWKTLSTVDKSFTVAGRAPAACQPVLPVFRQCGSRRPVGSPKEPRSAARATDGILYKSISNPVRNICVKAKDVLMTRKRKFVTNARQGDTSLRNKSRLRK